MLRKYLSIAETIKKIGLSRPLILMYVEELGIEMSRASDRTLRLTGDEVNRIAAHHSSKTTTTYSAKADPGASTGLKSAIHTLESLSAPQNLVSTLVEPGSIPVSKTPVDTGVRKVACTAQLLGMTIKRELTADQAVWLLELLNYGAKPATNNGD